MLWLCFSAVENWIVNGSFESGTSCTALGNSVSSSGRPACHPAVIVTPGDGSMETPEPGPADGEELLVELRPRTRSNPEGAEDRRSSTGSLGGNSNPSMTQSAVGSRVEGEGEASTSDSPASVITTTATVSAAAAQAAVVTAASSVPSAAPAPKERPRMTSPQQQQQSSGANSVPPPTEFQIRVPRVNCPEKVVGSRPGRWTWCFSYCQFFFLIVSTRPQLGKKHTVAMFGKFFLCFSKYVWGKKRLEPLFSLVNHVICCHLVLWLITAKPEQPYTMTCQH